MSESLPLYIVLFVQALLTLGILIFLYLNSRGFFSSAHISASKAKGKLEQRLVLESISTLSQVSGVQNTAVKYTTLALEKSGFNYCLFWLKEGERYCLVTETNQNCQMSLEHDDPLINWISKNPTPTHLGKFVLQFNTSQELEELLRPCEKGIMVPCIDGGMMEGFLFLGGEKNQREERTDQFYSLFGAIGAISLRKARHDEISAELEKRREQIENLARLGELAAGLAHEIRNPLTFVKSTAQHLVKSHKLSDSEPLLVEGLLEEIDRINSTIEDLLHLGRIDIEAFTNIDLVPIIKKVANVVDVQTKEKEIELELKLISSESIIKGDQKALHQLLLNLVINAIHSLAERKKVSITLFNEKSKAVVLVSDQGSGIPEKVRERIFEPFFSTKSSGTGLGLAISHNTAKAHGGMLSLIEAEQGYTTTFKLELPLQVK